MSMVQLLALPICLLTLAPLAAGAPAPDTQPTADEVVALVPPLPPMITPETQQSIDRGLEYLARTQSREGAWRNQGYMGQYPVAMTALAGLALLAHGDTTTQGKYAPQVSRAATFLLGCAAPPPSGLISRIEEESRS